MQLSLRLDADPILPRIRALLVTVHGSQQDACRLDPMAQFVHAMLSSQTYDAVSRAAFERLWLALRSWDLLLELEPDALLIHVRDVTHAEAKARHLVRSVRIIRTRRGRLDLAFLSDWSVEDAYAWLITLPGVGPKVAAATLNFSTLNKRIFVVDTHVLRTSRRFKLVPGKANFVRGFECLMRLVPDDWTANHLYETHWLMKLHGQTTCHVHRPDCDRCKLAALCPTKQGCLSRS